MAYDKCHRPLLYVPQVPGEAELRTCDLTAQRPFPLLQVSSLIFRQQSGGSRQTTHDKYQSAGLLGLCLFAHPPILRGHPAPRVIVGLEMASPSQGCSPSKAAGSFPPTPSQVGAHSQQRRRRTEVSACPPKLMGHCGPKVGLRVWGGTVSSGRDL